MKISFNQWGGSAPRLDPRAVPAGMAVVARNTRPDPFSLKPWQREKVTTYRVRPSAKTLYRYTDKHWFEWDTDVKAVPAPIVNDPYQEVIFCDNEGIKFTRNTFALSSKPYPNNSRMIGVPQPSKPIVRNNNTTPGDTDPDTIDVAYVITFVNEFGREGPASLPSNILMTKNDNVNITITRPGTPTGSYALGTNAKWRIYRTNTASDGSGIYQFVDEVPIATQTYTDRRKEDELLEMLSTSDWFPPPDRNTALWPSGPAKGLINVANSYLACFSGRTLCFSVPNIPHAWPPAYQIVVEYDIVGLAAVGSEIIVLTKGHPYIVTGSAPGNLTALKMPDAQACISANSIVAFENGVIYASPDGLCMVDGPRVKLISSDVFDERSWAAINPQNMVASYYEGSYVATTDKVTFLFIPNGEQAQYREINFKPKAMFNDIATDTLYYHEGDGVLKAFNKGEGNYEYEWQSGTVRTHKKTNLPWAAVYASDYPVTLTVITQFDCHHHREHVYNVTCSKAFRLHGGFLANEFAIKIVGNKTIHSVELANTVTELEH